MKTSTRDLITSALHDNLKNTPKFYKPGENSMTQAFETKKSTISLWRNDKADSKVRASGQIQLTPELLAQLQAETPDGRGYINARVVIFKNNSGNPKAPTSTGYIELAQSNNQQEEEF